MAWLWFGLGLALSAMLGRRLAEPGWLCLRPVLLAAGLPWPCVAALGRGRLSVLGLVGLWLAGATWVPTLLLALEVHALWTWRRGCRRARRAGRGL